MKIKLLFLLSVLTMLFMSMSSVTAQGGTSPNKSLEQLTPEQMKKAVVVADGSAESRSAMQSEFYRLANCEDDVNPDDPCFLAVDGSDNFLGTSTRSSGTITCGMNVYNALGLQIGRLQQNVGVIFHGAFGRTPLDLQYGDLRGTAASGGFAWSSLSGPNPTPGWGIYVPISGTASSVASGTISIAGFPWIMGAYVSTRLNIDQYGWVCS